MFVMPSKTLHSKKSSTNESSMWDPPLLSSKRGGPHHKSHLTMMVLHRRSSSPEWIDARQEQMFGDDEKKKKNQSLVDEKDQPVVNPRKQQQVKKTPLLLESTSRSPVKKKEQSEAEQQEDPMEQDALAQAYRLYTHYSHLVCEDHDSSNNKASSTTTQVPTVLTDPLQVSNMIHEDFDTILFDCDGVIYRHMDPCPGAVETIQSLICDPNKKVLFVSNNGAVSRQQLRDKLVKVLQLPQEIHVEQCISSAYSTAKYLQNQLVTASNPHPRVHMIGTDGLKQQLEHHGFLVHRLDDEDDASAHESCMTHAQVQDHTFPTEAFDAVVIGHDTDFHFRKIVMATNILAKNPHALFAATDLDSHDVVGSKSNHMPGNGPLVRCIEASSQRTAMDCGKPGRTLAKLLQHENDLPDLSRCLFVGDRLSSDIAFANRNGMKSLLVLTGVTTDQKLIHDLPPEGTDRDPLPHFICPHIGYLNMSSTCDQ